MSNSKAHKNLHSLTLKLSRKILQKLTLCNSKTVDILCNFKKVVKTYGSFSNYIWRFVDFTPLLRDWSKGNHVPPYTDLSKEVSNDMRGKGFKFFGPTICYAYMQAMGLVNDHEPGCFRFAQRDPV